MSILDEDEDEDYDDSPKLNIELMREHEDLYSRLAWQGLKRHGQKGFVFINYIEEHKFEASFTPRKRAIESLANEMPSILEYYRNKAINEGVEFDEQAIRRQRIQHILLIDNYDPATEIVVCIHDPFNWCTEQDYGGGYGKFVVYWAVFNPSKPVEEYYLDYIKQQYKPPEKKKKQQPEATLEHDLYCWLMVKGINVERQVSTASRHRLDLWIPGKMMLELKAGKITGDDVCQAIDYQATYEKQILLIGKGMSDAASRGIEGYNKATGAESIVFVSWEAARIYLGAVLRV